MEMNRKQFLGTMLAGVTAGCIPAFACLEKGTSEFEKCRNDILYFVDNYLVVDDDFYGKLKMTKQQREYLKRISTTPDYFFCAKGRQIGISTANNVFAYWKTTFFENQYVFIVEPNVGMKDRMKELYGNVSSSAFTPNPDNVHFIKPSTMMAHHLSDKNSTYILDEFDFWDNHCLDGLSKSHLDRFLLNSIWIKRLTSEQFEQFKAHVFEQFKSHMIVSSSICSDNGTFGNIMRYIDDSRRLVLPSPTRGLKA